MHLVQDFLDASVCGKMCRREYDHFAQFVIMRDHVHGEASDVEANILAVGAFNVRGIRFPLKECLRFFARIHTASPIYEDAIEKGEVKTGENQAGVTLCFLPRMTLGHK